MEVVFGSLEDVSPRQAWPHEATSFTPWLAENLDRLGREIGLELQLEGQEVRVGPFSADILAINPRDGSRVLIENQLEEGDHRHLGQILTYLTGLDAKTIIWIAPRFRDEHLSAVRWLNENTTEGISFFAVRLRVVRIGDSPFAPLFEVIERPNDWDRQVQEVARETRDASQVTALREAFWGELVARYPTSGFTPGKASARWVPVGVGGLVVSAYIGDGRVGVFLRGGRSQNEQVFSTLIEPNAAALENALGVELGNPDYPFTSRLEIDLGDETNWATAADWLVTRTTEYINATRQVLERPTNG